jgi:hypothetical protein
MEMEITKNANVGWSQTIVKTGCKDVERNVRYAKDIKESLCLGPRQGLISENLVYFGKILTIFT